MYVSFYLMYWKEHHIGLRVMCWLSSHVNDLCVHVHMYMSFYHVYWNKYHFDVRFVLSSFTRNCIVSYRKLYLVGKKHVPLPPEWSVCACVPVDLSGH